MQTMICCISKGHKVYESIRMGIGQGPPMHTLHIFERKWTLRFCNVSDDPRVKKKGDNLRDSLDVVTNVEAFEGGAGSASWGHDLALLRLLQVSTAHFTSYSGTFVLFNTLLATLVLLYFLPLFSVLKYFGTFCHFTWYFSTLALFGVLA